MSGNKKKKAHPRTSKFLHTPTMPFVPGPDLTVAEALSRMGRVSFQGRNLSTIVEIWKQMLVDEVVIFLGLAGAMSAAGMRKIITFLIEHRFIDCLVSTGANLFHDCYESLGHKHYVGNPEVNDNELREMMLDRVFDTYACEDQFRRLDKQIGEFAYEKLDLNRAYSTREFFYLLGKEISRHIREDGIVTSAYKHCLPIYCPAVADSSVGIALATYKDERRGRFLFDLIKDVEETAYIVAKARGTAVITIGGGTPKNFINQAEVTASIHLGYEAPGHKYAIQITTDAPHWGGLSGCTFQEAQSWGKIHRQARTATVYADATIALPLIATALAQSALGLAKKRKKPKFVMGQVLGIV